VNDSDDLAYRAELLLVRMCGVSPPPEMVNALLDNMFAAIRNSTASFVRTA
jgi:proteasome activator subunit 4